MANPNQESRVYAAAHFALELDGKEEVGLFRSVEGGDIKTDVMTYQNGANYDRYRQLGKPKFGDIKCQVGMAMTQPFYTWIANFFKGIPDRKTGAICAADFYYNERARRDFTGAIIKELTFPKLDAQDKNAAYMTVALAVEDIVFKKGDGKKLHPPAGFQKQKLWTASNFRLRLDGFDKACARVTKIDSFTVKQNVIEYHSGTQRAPIKCPSQVDFPQISFYVPEADAQPFFDHHKLRVVDGQVPGRLKGMIQTFDNDVAKHDLFTVSFTEADIVNVTPDKSDSGSDEIKQVKIDLYTESMTFEYHAVKTPDAPK